jgi:predicted secreted Zn-dependent protease
VTRAPNSHWGITARFFQEQEFEQRLEEQVLVGDEASLRQQVGSVFRQLIGTGPHKQAQETFDRVDRARVNERLGCRLDYMQTDGG